MEISQRKRTYDELCVRCYFKNVRKVWTPSQATSNSASTTDRARAYIWGKAQEHRISADFIANSWR